MLRFDGKISNNGTMYDLLAPQYRKYSDSKINYLNAIDNLVIANISAEAHSILDVGAGDGVRAVKIAKARNISQIILSDPSPSMVELCRQQPVSEVWQASAEDLPQTEDRFDAILCLWNVLGHIASSEKRLIALKNMNCLLSPRGTILIDVNNRYNANSYGYFRTIGRFLYDNINPSEKNGDVSFEWNIEGKKIPAMGHFFTPHEIKRLIHDSGLYISKEFAVNYQSGRVQHYSFQGQLFYILKNR